MVRSELASLVKAVRINALHFNLQILLNVARSLTDDERRMIRGD